MAGFSLVNSGLVTKFVTDICIAQRLKLAESYTATRCSVTIYVLLFMTGFADRQTNKFSIKIEELY